MDRFDALDAARMAVTARKTSYGTPESNFSRIARYWNAFNANRVDPTAPLTAHEVALMLDLLKTARIQNDPSYADSWIDKAGYAACGCEVAMAPVTDTPAEQQETLWEKEVRRFCPTPSKDIFKYADPGRSAQEQAHGEGDLRRYPSSLKDHGAGDD